MKKKQRQASSWFASRSSKIMHKIEREKNVSYLCKREIGGIFFVPVMIDLEYIQWSGAFSFSLGKDVKLAYKASKCSCPLQNTNLNLKYWGSISPHVRKECHQLHSLKSSKGTKYMSWFTIQAAVQCTGINITHNNSEILKLTLTTFSIFSYRFKLLPIPFLTPSNAFSSTHSVPLLFSPMPSPTPLLSVTHFPPVTNSSLPFFSYPFYSHPIPYQISNLFISTVVIMSL